MNGKTQKTIIRTLIVLTIIVSFIGIVIVRETILWETYKAPEFSFSYPPNLWSINDTDQDGVIIDIGFLESIELRSIDHNYESLDEELKFQIEEIIGSSLDNMDMVTIVTNSLPQSNSITGSWTASGVYYSSEEIKMQSDVTILRDNNQSLLIFENRRLPQEEKSRRIMSRIIGSIQIR